MTNDKLAGFRYGEGAGPELAGKLAKYTSFGCYPLFYLDAHDSVLCADCANAEEQCAAEERAELGVVLAAVPVVADVNWEDAHLDCDECSARIESAYAEAEE